MLIIAGTATIKTKDWDEAIKQVKAMTLASEAEAGCLSYQIYVHPTERNNFFIFEEWASQEALTQHFQTPHMQTFSAFLATVLAGQMKIKRYEVSAVSTL
jgi:quinol monooxygenase YgiN